MLITKQSMLSGKQNTRYVPITEDEMRRWSQGQLIQNVAPHLSPDDREFLISGITPEEWEATFGKEPEGDE